MQNNLNKYVQVDFQKTRGNQVSSNDMAMKQATLTNSGVRLFSTQGSNLHFLKTKRGCCWVGSAQYKLSQSKTIPYATLLQEATKLKIERRTLNIKNHQQSQCYSTSDQKYLYYQEQSKVAQKQKAILDMVNLANELDSPRTQEKNKTLIKYQQYINEKDKVFKRYL